MATIKISTSAVNLIRKSQLICAKISNGYEMGVKVEVLAKRKISESAVNLLQKSQQLCAQFSNGEMGGKAVRGGVGNLP